MRPSERNFSEHQMETYKSLIQLGTFGLKFVQVANGGAAIALLAYLGNIAGSGGVAPDVTRSMALFIAGLVLGGVATVTTYLTQLSLYNESIGDVERGSHKVWLWLSAGLVILGLVAFAVGALCATKSFAP